MVTRLERFLATLQCARTLEDLRGVILGLRDALGVDHVVYHSVNSIGQQYAVLTYDQTWVDRYIAQDYSRIDPVVQGCFRRFNPVDWKRLDWSARPSRSFLGEALEAGVGNQGFSVPIRGPSGQFAMFTVSDRVSDDLWQKFTAENTARLVLMAHFLNQKALEIERGTDCLASQSLSPREIDALTMLAMGLNRSKAAESLDISEHTLRAYVESARCKLGATNTTHAVARAVAQGLVRI